MPDRYSSEHTAMYVAIGDLVEMPLNSDRFTDQEPIEGAEAVERNMRFGLN